MPKPYNPHDRLMLKAKREGYRARSVYKLIDLNHRFHLLRPGQKVLDLGAAPGSWLQYVGSQIGSGGLAIGVDMQPITAIAPNIKTFSADIMDSAKLEEILIQNGPALYDLILSDLAPSTTGIIGVDHYKSIELSRKATEIAVGRLETRGSLVIKIFPGEHFNDFFQGLKKQYRKVNAVKVGASRDRSREIYIVCTEKKAINLNT